VFWYAVNILFRVNKAPTTGNSITYDPCHSLCKSHIAFHTIAMGDLENTLSPKHPDFSSENESNLKHRTIFFK
jgi:hypothetical protein